MSDLSFTRYRRDKKDANLIYEWTVFMSDCQDDFHHHVIMCI